MTAAGKKNAPVGRYGRTSPKFGHQNALHGPFTRPGVPAPVFTEVTCLAAGQYRPDAHDRTLLWCAAHFGGFGSAIALLHHACVWNGQSQKFGYGNHLASEINPVGYGQNTKLSHRSQ